MSRVVLAVLLLIGLAESVFAQDWVWQYESVDTSGKFTSIAVDKDGNVHVSYEGGKGITYAFRPAGQSKWFKMLIDHGEGYTGLALDASGNPHICYTTGQMKYAGWVGHRWKVQEIAPYSGNIVFTCSISMDAMGAPHLTWYTEKLPDGTLYAHLRYAVLRNHVWEARTVDFDALTGKWNSMALDTTGDPRVCYPAFAQGDFKYAQWDGKRWHVSQIEHRTVGEGGNYTSGLGCSLVLDKDGQADISFEDDTGAGSESSLKYAQQRGNRWSIETVDAIVPLGGWQGWRTSLILDREGLPHIAYEDAGALKHAYWYGNKWHVQVIAPAAGDPYRYSEMALGKDDTLYISYRDPVDGSIRVAIGHRSTSAQTFVQRSTK